MAGLLRSSHARWPPDGLAKKNMPDGDVNGDP